MNSRTKVARSANRACLVATLAAVVLSAVAASPQTWTESAVLPETATLSAHEYHNAYYNLTFDIPDAPSKNQVHLAPMRHGVHALLAMSFADSPVTTEIWLFSLDSASGRTLEASAAANEFAAEIARRRDALGYEPISIRPEKKGALYFVEQYRYSEKRTTLDIFFSRRGHLLRLNANTTEPDPVGFRNWLLKAIHLDIDNKDLPSNGQPYFGPTLPDAVVEQTIATKPGRNLPADDGIQGANYVNNTVKLRYRFPFQWKAEDLNAPQSRVFQVDASEAELATRLHQLFTACSKPLLRLAGRADANQSLSLISMDPACLQLSFPGDEGHAFDDARARDDFAQVLLAYPDFGEVRSAKFTRIGGHPFLVLHSLLPDTLADGLRRRRMQTAYITERNGQMLFWFFTANSEAQIPTLDVEFLPAR